MDKRQRRIEKAEQWVFYFMCGFALFSSLSIAIGNIFLILGLVATAYRLYLKHDDLKDIFYKNKQFTKFFLLLIGAILLTFISSDHPVHSLRIFGDYYGYRMCGFYMVLLSIREREKLLTLLKIAAGSCVINGLHCVWEFLVYGSTRADGFVGFYMTTGSILSFWGPVTVLLALAAFEKKRYQLFAFAGLLFMIIVQLCNQTRGAWLALAVTSIFIVLAFMKNSKKAVAMLLGGMFILGLVFTLVPQLNHRVNSMANLKANNERLLIWTSAYHMFEDRPILGMGFGEFRGKYQKEYILPEAKERNLGHAHSNVMQMLAEGGTVGITAWFVFWGYTLWLGISGWRKTHELVYLAWFATILGLLVQGLTEYNQGNSVVTKQFWFLIGIYLQLMWLSNNEKHRTLQ